nr:flocculation protein FLO11-like [Ipomoea batatas]
MLTLCWRGNTAVCCSVYREVSLSTDDECGEHIYRKTLARLEDKDDSSDDPDEELEGVVDISSSSSEDSTAHMESRHAALRARHKGKATAAEKAKGKAVDATPDPTLIARLPPIGVVMGGSPTFVALAVARQPRLRKWNSYSSTPTTAKKARRPSDVVLEDAAAATKTFIFCRLGQMISVSDLQAMEGASPSYLLQSVTYQSFQAGLNDTIKGLAKDSKLLKSAKAAHSKEVKALKSDLTTLGGNLATTQDGFVKATEASMHARTIVDQWLEGGVGRQYLLDLGEADYGMGYQDAQKEIFRLLKARDATFSPTRWDLLNPVTPDDNQGVKDVALNTSLDTLGGEISMDNT